VSEQAVIVAPFPFRLSGSVVGYRHDWWHISPDVDLPGVRQRGGILCRTGRVGLWGGPETEPAYYLAEPERVAQVCPACSHERATGHTVHIYHRITQLVREL
jgi:hypothetical protein